MIVIAAVIGWTLGAVFLAAVVGRVVRKRDLMVPR